MSASCCSSCASTGQSAVEVSRMKSATLSRIIAALKCLLCRLNTSETERKKQLPPPPHSNTSNGAMRPSKQRLLQWTCALFTVRTANWRGGGSGEEEEGSMVNGRERKREEVWRGKRRVCEV